MQKYADLTGLKQGKLTVCGPRIKKGRQYYWFCECECGNKKYIRQDVLKRGQQSCGCLQGSNLKGVPSYNVEEIGKKYGMLTVIEYAGKIYGRESKWLCKCDCGNTVVKTWHTLRKGNPSCGCFLKNNGHKPFHYEVGDVVETNYSKFKIVSQFRKLKKNSKSHDKYYECECLDCHEKTVIQEATLDRLSGSCKACSESRSFPSKFVYWFLKQLDIPFETEYSPEWSGRYRYDYYFLNNGMEYALEVDGLDHFNEKTRNEKTLEEILEIDRYKEEMAKEHGIEVIRLDCRFSNLTYIVNSIKKSKMAELFDIDDIEWDLCIKSWGGDPRLY